MDNPNPNKVAKVDEIAEKLSSADTVVVTEYRGLDVPAQATLRAAVKEAGGEFKIYKNSLAKLAAERTGHDLAEHLSGPTALAFAYENDGRPADPVSLTKALTEFAKTNEALVIKGGVMDGEVIDGAQINALSKVPPRDEMLAMFAGLLQAPMAKFAGLLQAMPREMAGLLKALVDKGGAGVAEEAPAEEAPAEEAPAEVAEEAPAAEAPAEAADEAPAEETPAEEAPVAEAADDAPAGDETDEAATADSEETEEKED